MGGREPEQTRGGQKKHGFGFCGDEHDSPIIHQHLQVRYRTFVGSPPASASGFDRMASDSLFYGVVKLPVRLEVGAERLFEQAGADELDGDGAEVEDAVVELLFTHFAACDELFVQGDKLQAAEHVAALV